MRECFRIGEVTKGMNKSFIVMIPKVKQAMKFSHFRPISLCNFMYKIISKIITLNLKVILPKMVSPNQGAFIEGRRIANKTVLVHELVHKVKKFKGKKGLLIVKLNLKKAYDRLECVFVDKVLKC